MTKQKQNLYQHYSSSEHQFIDKVKDMIEQVEWTYVPYLTDFVDPRQETIIKELLAPTDLVCYSSKKIITDEYHRVIIAPAYYELKPEDFDIVLLEIDYPTKFFQLTHSQIMGTLIHGLGFKRSVFGDIMICGDRAQFFMEKTLLSYVLTTDIKIARAPIKCYQVDYDKKINNQDNRISDLYLVSSLRLDKVVSTVLHLSRSESQKLFEQEKIKVNFKVVTKVTQEIQLMDLISVRGFGRFQVIEKKGQTAKGKHKIVIKK